MKGKTLLCLAFIGLMLFGVFMVGQVGAQSTTIGVEPEKTIDPNLAPGSWFTVEIWIRDVSDLAGIEFKLGYDTAVLTATSITYGGIFGDTYFPLGSEIHDADGYLFYGIMEAFGEPGFDGDGKVAIINFTLDSSGESVLDLYETKPGDSAVPPNPISHTVIDGYFSNIHMWFHSEGGLIDLSSPVCTYWHELYPDYCNRHHLTEWLDSQGMGEPGYNELSVCDFINMTPIDPSGPTQWFHVENLTVTINTTYPDVRPNLNSPSSTSGGWTTGDGAYADGGTSASISSGKPSASQYYGGYGFNIPTDATIDEVKVRLDAWTDGNEEIHLKVSEDGGSTWLASAWSTGLGGSEVTYWVDVTGWTSWTPAKINSDMIQTQVWAQTVGGGNPVYLDWIPINVTYTVYLPMFIEFEGNIQDFNWANPLYTQWHEVCPVFSRNYNLTDWTDNGASGLNVCDDIQLKNKDTEVVAWYHVDGISTDIVGKKVPTPEIPEFPLGTVLPIALAVAVMYVWLINKRKRTVKQQ